MDLGAEDVGSLYKCGAVIGNNCKFFRGISDSPGCGSFPSSICGRSDSTKRSSVQIEKDPIVSDRINRNISPRGGTVVAKLFSKIIGNVVVFVAAIEEWCLNSGRGQS